MSSNAIPMDQLSYEQAFAELESIIYTLETEETALEDAIQLYERGQALAQRCGDLLEKAELRVRVAGKGLQADPPDLDGR
jgi:exodeoxyribonuclease VII small subunit